MKNSLSNSTRRNRFVYQAAGAASILLLWQLAAVLLSSRIILPSPGDVGYSLLNMIGGMHFWAVSGQTLLRWLAGLAPAFCAGLLLGVLSAYYEKIGAFIRPYFTLIKSVPVVSFILLALIWFKAPFVPSFVVFLAAFPSVADNAAAGVRNIDRRLLQMAQVYDIRGIRRFLYIYLPSIASFLFAALRTGVGIGMKAVVVAELVVQPVTSIGAELQKARVTLQTDIVLAWTLVVVIISYLLEHIVALFERRAQRWREA